MCGDALDADRAAMNFLRSFIFLFLPISSLGESQDEQASANSAVNPNGALYSIVWFRGRV